MPTEIFKYLLVAFEWKYKMFSWIIVVVGIVKFELPQLLRALFRGLFLNLVFLSILNLDECSLFWTRLYPLGSIVIALVRPSICLSIFKYLRDHSLLFSETLHGIRGPLSKKSDTAGILKKNLNPGIKGD